jgi:hypothetical protein
MEDLDRLIDTFSARPPVPIYRKLDVLMDLEQLRDPRSVPFLLKVVRDRKEPLEVRMRTIRPLRLVSARARTETPLAANSQNFSSIMERQSCELRPPSHSPASLNS